VPADQTARALFARLPHGSGYAERMIECLATGYLVAVIESVCIGRVQEHIQPDEEVVVGLRVHLEHRRPMPASARVALRGWVEGLSQRSVTFRVRAHDAQELVCDASVTLVVLPRAQMEARIDAKRALLVNGADHAGTGIPLSPEARTAGEAHYRATLA
jgi:predicted thioesterase